MSNIKQVAKAAGVSTATVSRVLNQSGYVSDASRKKVNEAIERLQYRPSAVARSLKQDKTYTIGVIIPDISNVYFMSMAKGIEQITGVHGYQILFSSSDEDPGKEEHLLRLMQDKRVDVVVLVPSGRHTKALKKLVQLRIPVIVADRILTNTALPVDQFIENNAQASYELTCQLIQQGHKRIGVIHGGLEASTSKERLEGFHLAMEEHGITLEKKLQFNGHYTMEGGVAAASYFIEMSNRPTAIFSLNNSMAFGALLTLKRYGINIPEQLTFASYGAIDGAEFLESSKILYVKQKPYEMGVAIGNRIIECQIEEEGKNVEPIIQRFQNDICNYE